MTAIAARVLFRPPGLVIKFWLLDDHEASSFLPLLRAWCGQYHTYARDPAGKPIGQGLCTAPERRNTVVNDVFVHPTRFNHP